MKIALCLHGYYNSSGGPESGNLGYEYIKEKILLNNDVDVFVHSWDIPAKELILQNYKPVSSEFEDQYNFEEELKTLDLSWYEEGFDRAKTMYKNSVFQSLSFLLSRKKVLEIKRKYEQNQEIEYDCVVLCRFDLGNRGKEHPQTFYATDIDFNPKADMSLLHMKYWNQFNWGIPDHWFYSNSKTMDQLGLIYDRVYDYLKKDSEYVKAVTTAWPESNEEYEFSNEMLEDKKSEKLIKFEKWHCIDNHKIYKWFFHETGLSKNIGFGESYNLSKSPYAIVMYSHSSYSDSWPMFFGQVDQYFENCSKYIFCDKKTEEIPKNWKCITYNEELPYNRRVHSCLQQVNEDVVIFHHEDMPLYLKPEFETLENLCEILSKEEISFIKLLRGGSTDNDSRYKDYENLYQISDRIHYMAVQPTIWEKQSLLKVYDKSNVEHIRDFENYASYICYDEEIEGVYYYSGEPKKGLYHYESRVYPYIATAISAGKWNTKEYKKEIDFLSKKYNINLNDRGTND